jgi:ferritin
MFKEKELKHLFKKSHLQTSFWVLSNIINLAQLAIQENDQETAVRF